MSDGIEYLTQVVADLRARLDAQPTYRWGTVKYTQIANGDGFVPRFLALLDGMGDTQYYVDDSLLATKVSPGDRVLVQIHQGTMVALAHTRSSMNAYPARQARKETPANRDHEARKATQAKRDHAAKKATPERRSPSSLQPASSRPTRARPRPPDGSCATANSTTAKPTRRSRPYSETLSHSEFPTCEAGSSSAHPQPILLASRAARKNTR